MSVINIGGNHFEGVAIPLRLDDRFFIQEVVGGKDLWTVFTFRDGKPVLEVLKNSPQENPFSAVTTNPTGIITVAHPTTGKFQYKIRPGKGESSIFGTIGGQETEIRVRDHEIRVGTNVFQNNAVKNFPVGISVQGGSISLGAPFPPEFVALMS